MKYKDQVTEYKLAIEQMKLAYVLSKIAAEKENQHLVNRIANLETINNYLSDPQPVKLMSIGEYVEALIKSKKLLHFSFNGSKALIEAVA